MRPAQGKSAAAVSVLPASNENKVLCLTIVFWESYLMYKKTDFIPETGI